MSPTSTSTGPPQMGPQAPPSFAVMKYSRRDFFPLGAIETQRDCADLYSFPIFYVILKCLFENAFCVFLSVVSHGESNTKYRTGMFSPWFRWVNTPTGLGPARGPIWRAPPPRYDRWRHRGRASSCPLRNLYSSGLTFFS